MMFERKHIDFTRYNYQEVNPIEYSVKEKNKLIKIANFRYPAVD